MSSSRSAIVVAPGCSAGLIQELLEANLLPAHADVEIFLLNDPHQHADPISSKIPCERAKFFLSPARSFFSTRHFKWLRENLRSPQNPMLLIPQSPYKDPYAGMASLITLLLAGKTITLLRVGNGAADSSSDSFSGENGQETSKNWMFIELNRETLTEELRKTIWSSYPDSVRRLIEFTDRELSHFFGVYETVKPASLAPLDSSPEALQKDLEHSFTVGGFYLANVPGGMEFLKGKKVLEVGPGINFGPMLILACHGARVMAVDRFLTPWNSEYHPRFYQLLKESLTDRWPSINTKPLDMVLSQRKYSPESISLFSCSLEESSIIPNQSVDIIVSHTVFEHFYDLKSAFSQLARITKPGGLGIHYVDFRDHRDFSRPLEYLLLSDREFTKEFKERLGECGNRYRPQEMRQLLEAMGFEVRKFEPTHCTEEHYLEEFQNRLKKCRKSRYRHFSVEDFQVLEGIFVLEKK